MMNGEVASGKELVAVLFSPCRQQLAKQQLAIGVGCKLLVDWAPIGLGQLNPRQANPIPPR
jgi:hypothetical protein